MTTWDQDANAAIDAGVKEAAQKDVELKAANDEIQRLKDELNKPVPIPTPDPGPTPTPSGKIFGFAGPDPTGQAPVKRVYLNPPDPFPKYDPKILLVVTYKGTNHADRAKQVKAFGGPLYFGWTHEPENGANNISASTYVVEWNKMCAALKAENVTNIIGRIWCLMSATFQSSKAASYYPGDQFVEVVAADGYDWCGCRPPGGDGNANPTGSHRSMGAIFDKVVTFAKLHGKDTAFLEFGTPTLKSGVETGRAAWINDAIKYCNSKPQGVKVVAATYFQHGVSDGFRCNWTLKGASLDAYKAAF